MFGARRNIVLLLVTQVFLVQQCSCIFKLTSVECKSLDSNYCRFQTCRLKAVRRHVSALYIHVNLLQLPLNDLSINIQLFQRTNGYQPFLVNGTWDLCAFLAKRKRNTYMNVFYGLFKDYANLNHSCPYNHDLIVDGAVPIHSNMPLPWPTGEYLLKTAWLVQNRTMATVDLKVEFTEENIFLRKRKLN